MGIKRQAQKTRREAGYCLQSTREGNTFEGAIDKDGRIIKASTIRHKRYFFDATRHLFDSPHLLCSGLVVRYQFKTYPKPIRSRRTSVELGHDAGADRYERGPEYTYQ